MDELASRRAIKQILDDVENGVQEEIPPEIVRMLEMDWRILLKNAILDAKEDCILVAYNMQQVVYGKQIILENNIKHQIKFAVFSDEIPGVPVGSRQVV